MKFTESFSQTNSMIPHYIPCELRQMRLDRILLKKGTEWSADSPMQMFATEPINPPHYLFQSDHYGLLIPLKPEKPEEAQLKLNPKYFSDKYVELPHMGIVGKIFVGLRYVWRVCWM